MKFGFSNKKYFYFSLEDNDWRQHGYYRCRQLLNAIQNEIPKNQRYWIKDMKAWAIKNEYKNKLSEIIQNYLGQTQMELEI